MIERHLSTDGNPILTGVFSRFQAVEELAKMGYEIHSQGVLNIYVKDYYTHEPKSRGYVHVHFFGKDGMEIAYYTPMMQTLHVFLTPRQWHPDFVARLEQP